MTGNELKTKKQSLSEASSTFAQRLTRVVLIFVIIVGGIAGGSILIRTAPKAGKRPPAKMMPLVRAMTITPGDQRVILRAMGIVIPEREIVLNAQVAGEILWLHEEFTEGGMLKKGDLAMRIDPQDYELALEQKKRAVADALYEMKLELGRQDVAQREWALLGKDESAKDADGELALRKPHLKKVQAELAAAEAELAQAELNLSRTKVTIPFNVLVRAKYVDKGSNISPQDRLADLVGTDAYRVQVSVPVHQLKWINIPNEHSSKGSVAKIIYRNNFQREGRVERLMGDLETKGRMARLLVSVNDPLDLNRSNTQRPPLLIGEYVRVEIEGAHMEDVFRIPRSALRHDTAVWIATENDELEIRDVLPVWRDEQTVLIKSGLRPGERLIVSNLSAPVDGMPVKVQFHKAPASGDL